MQEYVSTQQSGFRNIDSKLDLFFVTLPIQLGFPGGASNEESAYQFRQL